MQRLPWFPFFVDDWDGDEKVRLMSYTERGVYLTLLCHQWREGSLPADAGQVRDLLHSPDLPTLEALLNDCFPVRRGTTRRYNPKLEQIRRTQSRLVARRAEAGRVGGVASGAVRALKARSKRSTVVQRSSKQNEETQTQIQRERQTQDTTEAKALVALTGDALIQELHQLASTTQTNGAARGLKAKFVFAYWAARWNHRQAIYDRKRQDRLCARLRENHDNVSELLYVVDGARRDDWAERPQFCGIEHIFRDRGVVERLAALVPEYVQGKPHKMAVEHGLSGNGNG